MYNSCDQVKLYAGCIYAIGVMNRLVSAVPFGVCVCRTTGNCSTYALT